MKLDPQIQKLNQAGSVIESASGPPTPFAPFTDSDSEPETAVFPPALIQILNTFIYLCHRQGLSGRHAITSFQGKGCARPKAISVADNLESQE